MVVITIVYFDICINEIHTFNNKLNEEGMITSHLMCGNFLYDKNVSNFCFYVTTFQQ